MSSSPFHTRTHTRTHAPTDTHAHFPTRARIHIQTDRDLEATTGPQQEQEARRARPKASHGAGRRETRCLPLRLKWIQFALIACGVAVMCGSVYVLSHAHMQTLTHIQAYTRGGGMGSYARLLLQGNDPKPGAPGSRRLQLNETWAAVRAQLRADTRTLLATTAHSGARIHTLSQEAREGVPCKEDEDATVWSDTAWKNMASLCRYAPAPSDLHVFVSYVAHEMTGATRVRMCTLIRDVYIHAGDDAFITFHVLVDSDTATGGVPIQFGLQTALPPLPRVCYRLYDFGIFWRYSALFSRLQRVFAAASDRVNHITAVWLVKPFLYDILPPSVDAVISVDIDARVAADVLALVNHTIPRMRATGAVVALAPELMPTYRHFGLQSQGYNGGVQVHDLRSIRRGGAGFTVALRSFTWPSQSLPLLHVVAEYGDQTLYSLLAERDPSFVYPLGCEWNRQLCRGWFQQYLPASYGVNVTERQWCEYEHAFTCTRVLYHGVKILHGSCADMRPGSAELDGPTQEWTARHLALERAYIRDLQVCPSR